MKRWVSVKDRVPPDDWFGFVVADARPDKPVIAHTGNERYRLNFPYADYFLGKWREALLVSDSYRDKAKVTHWLETDEELYPATPSSEEKG